MGAESSGVPELDAALAGVCERYRAAKPALVAPACAAETALGRELRPALESVARSVRALRARAARGDSAELASRAHTYANGILMGLVRKTLERTQPTLFSVFFRALLALKPHRDAVSQFMWCAGSAHEKLDDEGAVVRALDCAHIARCLRLVFTRFRGDANAPANQAHGGARTPLINAIVMERPDLVRVLLAHGADAGIASYNNEFPLEWACRARSEALVRLVAPYSARALAYYTDKTHSVVALRRRLLERYFARDAAARLAAALVGVCGLA